MNTLIASLEKELREINESIEILSKLPVKLNKKIKKQLDDEYKKIDTIVTNLKERSDKEYGKH